MAQLRFEYLYGSTDGGATINFLSPATQREASFDEPLNIGDTVTITVIASGSTTTVSYLGYTESGDLVLSFPGSASIRFLTNQPYIRGDTFPAYTAATYCFLAGTVLATPAGTTAVEDLAIGDLVRTAGGGVAPVKWIGRQTVVTRFGAPVHRAPIAIAAGALGGGLPLRELRLTEDHALMFDGLLVQAGALVNGTSIRRMAPAELGERFTVYHVELDGHALVLAEGVPAETFLDNATRARFDNYPDYLARYGAPAAIAEMDMPRVKSARQLPETLRARIAAAAGADPASRAA
ncbi:hypothetical protein J2X65_003834 [Ancylobacter sp. 3268]|uniref:Hint domain-containing protein n=1 Tax=Ancylobacter sp. 3268 TaxID=2817752 RepID=UPI0028575384|nr:Hint domain-containing protein [Ancylobacter sp. 3268]MDR6954460.1 hypothetical protein [Ancylobacter sp. 3268]